MLATSSGSVAPSARGAGEVCRFPSLEVPTSANLLFQKHRVGKRGARVVPGFATPGIRVATLSANLPKWPDAKELADLGDRVQKRHGQCRGYGRSDTS